MLRYILLSLLNFFITFHSFSQTQLSALFSDDTVLQQQQLVAVWGTDKPHTKISVVGSLGKNAMVVADNDGHWKLKLQTPVAGGPYAVVIKGSKVVTLKNVLIGEVW